MRYISEWFQVSVTLRHGEICVVDWHDVGGSMARTTQLYPAVIGKLVRSSALPRPSVNPFSTSTEDDAKQKWVQAVGATGELNLYRTTADILASSDGQEVRFLLLDPSEGDVGGYSNPLGFLRLSSHLMAMQHGQGESSEDGTRGTPPDLTQPGNRILIAPWKDPEMIGQAILNIFAMSRPPVHDPEGSVFDRPRPKQRIKLHKAAIAGDLSAFPKATRGSRSFDPTDSDLVTPLMLAAHHGTIQIVEKLVSLGANPSLADKRGHTPLHHAAHGGHKLVVDALLNAGASMNAADDVGRTPVHIAAAHGHSDVVLRLLAAGADANDRDGEYASSPLHLAARGGHAHIVPILLGHGAEVESANEAGRTPLHVAASYGHLGVVNALIEAGADVNRRDLDGETPLFRPTFFQHDDVMRLLVTAGGDVRVSNADGDTPLHVAAKMNRERAAVSLMNSGANVEALNADGLTPLDCALVNPHFIGGILWLYHYIEHNSEAAGLLAQRGASVDPMRLPVEERHVLWPHLTPIELLMPSGDIDEIKLLLGLTRGKRREPTSWLAAWRYVQSYLGMKGDGSSPRDRGRASLAESVKHALELASQAEWQPHNQSAYVHEADSILHDAVSKGMTGFIEFLLPHGISTVPGTHQGGTPLHRACALGLEEVARFLIESGADIEAPQVPSVRLHRSTRAFGRHIRPGWTALDQAIRSERIGMISLLLDMGAIPPDRLEDAEAASFWDVYRNSHLGGFNHPLSPFLGFNKDALDSIIDLFDRRGSPIVGPEKLREINEAWKREHARLARSKAGRSRRGTKAK